MGRTVLPSPQATTTRFVANLSDVKGSKEPLALGELMCDKELVKLDTLVALGVFEAYSFLPIIARAMSKMHSATVTPIATPAVELSPLDDNVFPVKIKRYTSCNKDLT